MAVTCHYQLIPGVGVMVVIASAATFMPVTGKSKVAKVKDMTMRNRPIGELWIVRSRVGVVIGAVGAVHIGAVNAVCTIESIGVDAGFAGMDKSAAPGARILVVLGSVGVVIRQDEGGFGHAVIVDILFVARREAQSSDE